ncbi:MAG: thiamine pyrophosphate-dependent dehydrogenase E1 component subunit alpha [Odoribacter sp.]|nr:thiamine pyrophosphate-dependent dehydrogenase E1 component subunit alpha [Odoribacter sp.]
MLRKMMFIREFEDVVSECKDQKLIYGGTHCCNGEEAVAVGVCAALKADDYIVSNHRPHGHAIAKGANPKRIMAEMFGRIDGTNSGKGGSMHIHDSSVGLMASTGIVGSGIPVGCGTAFAAKYEGKKKISCVFFGDGSANEGVLHETLNLASVWNLPILFLLEDNELAITTDTRETSVCNDYVKLASSYRIDGLHVDGQDVEMVYEVAAKAVDYIRTNSKPYFIQAHTIRFKEHQEGAYYRRMIGTGYRDYSKLDEEKENCCPIRMYISKLKKSGLVTDQSVEEIQREIKLEVSDCVEYAIASPEPELWQAVTDVFREA